nr:DUF2808 domain-containing protein [Petrachloros mirabilis]
MIFIVSHGVVTQPSLASGRPSESQATHLVDAFASPAVAQALNHTYSIKLHVGNKPIKAMVITIPSRVKVRNGVNVQNRSGELIDSSYQIEDRQIKVNFEQALESEQIVRISLQGVRSPRYSNTWMLPVSIRHQGIDFDIPVGTAYIRTFD